MALEGYYTTTEAAALLGLKPPSVRNAVMRGRLAVERLGDRNLVTAAEVERYRVEVLGTRGWEERKAGEHASDAGARERQRTYRERKRARAGA
jgi:excisionase family DNA binding protein